MQKGSEGTALKGVGVTASQLDRPTLTPLSVARWGRLQAEVAHWTIAVSLPTEVVDNLPHK